MGYLWFQNNFEAFSPFNNSHYSALINFMTMFFGIYFYLRSKVQVNHVNILGSIL